jgi:flavin reductase (DIM6/NTAB) family NADH-FMN oxidoreductase RutF
MDRLAGAAQFKLGMRQLAGAVSIITSCRDGRLYGMTATAVCSACADPPTVLACVNHSTTTHEAIDAAKVFCVNVLRHEDRELSSLFSGLHHSETRGEARFRQGSWTRLATGSPVLVNALVSFDCRVTNHLVHGTHTIFLGQVEQLQIGRKGKPLLYSDGQYAKLASIVHAEPLPEGLDYWGE